MVRRNLENVLQNVYDQPNATLAFEIFDKNHACPEVGVNLRHARVRSG